MDYKDKFIKFMAEAEVLTFGDFTTKAGRKSPYFVNTGKYCTGEQIAKLGEFYASCIIDNVKLKPDEKLTLFGPAYKGIPLVVTTAIALLEKGINVNYCFNRKEVKEHGEGGDLVGYKLTSGDKVLIIEDVISAGTAVREVVPLIESTGAIVEGLVISVDRMERGKGERSAVQEVHEEFGIRTYPIVTVRDIIKSMAIDENLVKRMETYLVEYGV